MDKRYFDLINRSGDLKEELELFIKFGKVYLISEGSSIIRQMLKKRLILTK